MRDDDGVRPARLHVDHIMPCALRGTADPWNLQALCGVCNVAKGSQWWRGSPHHLARRQLVAAYATYLRDYLSEPERRDLADELSILGMATTRPGGSRCGISWRKSGHVARARQRPARNRRSRTCRPSMPTWTAAISAC